MRRIIINEFQDLSDALSSYSSMFAYRIKNLCVKVDTASLLPIQVMVEGEMQNLEKCTIIAQKDDYNYMIFPKFDEDMDALQQGIAVAHPEFKQKIESMKVDTVDREGKSKQTDARYVLVTMPDVDDERYDILKDGVKLAYDQCKAQMDAANAKADVRLAELCVGESKENMDLIKQERDKLNEQWEGHRDKLYNEKLQEIEDAHNKWLADRDAKEQKRQEDEASHSDSAAHSMKIDQDEMAN